MYVCMKWFWEGPSAYKLCCGALTRNNEQREVYHACQTSLYHCYEVRGRCRSGVGCEAIRRSQEMKVNITCLVQLPVHAPIAALADASAARENPAKNSITIQCTPVLSTRGSSILKYPDTKCPHGSQRPAECKHCSLM